MKKAKETKTEINLLQPVNIPDAKEDDCFGREYFPQDRNCSMCSDIELCGIKYQEIIKKKVKTIEVEKGPFLDQVDFKAVNWIKLEKKAIEYQDSGEPLTFSELLDAIKTIVKIKDEIAVIEFIKRELPLTKMYIQEGNIYVRR